MSSQLLALPMPTHDGKLSVMFSPRLHLPANLAAYTQWKDWPIWANANLNVRIQLESAAGVTSTFNAPAPDVAPDPLVWRALFGNPNANPTPQLPVIPFQYTDRRNQNITSWGGAEGYEIVQSFYQALAVAFPEKAPTQSQVTPGLVSQIASASSSFRAYVASLHNPNGPAKVAAAPPYWGFHEMVHMASAHPYLMRLLGLVVDYTIPAVTTNPAKVRILTDFPDQIPCAMQLSSGFRALPNPASLLPVDEDGWVKASGFKLSNIDHQTGVHQFTQWADNLADGENPLPIPPTPGISVQIAGPPQIIEQGITNHWARSGEIEDQIKTLGPNDEVELFRDDLVAGYRFDVLDESKPGEPYRSLFQRRPIPETGGSLYRFPETFTVDTVPDDEGWMAFSMVSEAVEPVPQPNPNINDNGDWVPTAPQRFSPQLMLWDGWSNATPRPGNVLDGDGNVIAPDPNENDPVNGVGRTVGVNYAPVPGSLPQLRFGHSYRFRCRAVDVMGNSQPPTAATPGGIESPSIVFGRTMPLPAPVPVRTTNRPDPGVGDTVTQLVIKSELGQDLSTVAPTRRAFFPMPATQRILERHGLPGDGDTASQYTNLVTRDGLSIEDQTSSDPATGERVLDGIALFPTTDYWPDPAIGAISFQGLPGASGPTLAAIQGLFPDRRLWKFQLEAGTAAPVVTPVGATAVTASSPQGTIRNIRVSCAPNDLSEWNLNYSTSPQVQQAIDDGTQWLAEGYTSMRLIHAVRLPLILPVPTPLAAARTILTDGNEDPNSPASGLGSLTAEIDVDVLVNANSTGSVAVRGTWTDPIDLGPGATAPGVSNDEGDPGTVTKTGEMGSLSVFYTEADIAVSGDGMILDVNDTKAHDVFVTAEAYSRYSAHFTEKTQFSFVDDSPVVIDAKGISPGSVEITNVNGGAIGTSQYSVDALAGTITPNSGGALDGALAVNVQFIPLPVSRLSTEAGGIVPQVVVPASKGPLEPAVIEVLPSASRNVRVEGSSTRIRHNGQVLRLQMQRPWWTSGRDERLAVVVSSADEPGTAVGRDPIFDGDGTDALTTMDDWRRSLETGIFDGLTIASHDVSFDVANDVWVADIELAGDFGYRPFIQPVVARFQPDAIAGAYLSPRVMLDPHRLGVMREVQVRSGQSSVAITVTGPDNPGVSFGAINFNEATVTMQERDPDIDDDDLTWRDVAGIPALSLTRSVRSDGWVSYTGKIGRPSGGGDYRLLIEETEPSRRQEGVVGTLVVARDVMYTETVELQDV